VKAGDVLESAAVCATTSDAAIQEAFRYYSTRSVVIDPDGPKRMTVAWDTTKGSWKATSVPQAWKDAHRLLEDIGRRQNENVDALIRRIR
jgi:hypothetical protein